VTVELTHLTIETRGARPLSDCFGANVIDALIVQSPLECFYEA
jgi:hypothetical protein